MGMNGKVIGQHSKSTAADYRDCFGCSSCDATSIARMQVRILPFLSNVRASARIDVHDCGGWQQVCRSPKNPVMGVEGTAMRRNRFRHAQGSCRPATSGSFPTIQGTYGAPKPLYASVAVVSRTNTAHGRHWCMS
jgi:hypothetical protein